MRRSFLPILLLFIIKASAQRTYTKTQYHEDLNYFWKTLDENYCYFDKKNINWNKLKPIYDAQVDTVSSRAGFVSTMERALYELYDHHCSLRTNNDNSRRLVPTGTDMWAEYQNGKPVITEIRKGFGAENVGIRTGMEIVAVNDLPIDKAILQFLPHTVNNESKSFALRLLLAGDHQTKRKFTVKNGGKVVDFYPDQNGMMLENVEYPAMVESKIIGNIGYIKVNNYLFDNTIIAKFDSALNSLMNTKALIIDLRETPSGGNTSVARAILGRFISTEHFYQKHELYSEEKLNGVKRSWVEIVSPHGKTYKNPVVVLADHWTGSVGEGITVAFDGMKRATVIGTKLARLNGAIDGDQMPNTKIGFNIPTERLYHINGTPREQYNPTITVDVTSQKPGNDVIFNTAINYLHKRIK